MSKTNHQHLPFGQNRWHRYQKVWLVKVSLQYVGTVVIYFSTTLQETNISPKNGILKMIFLLPRWDMLIPWRVYTVSPSTTFFHLWRRYRGFSVPWLGSMAAKGLRVILPTAPKGYQPWGPLETTWHQLLGTFFHAWNLEGCFFWGGDGWVGGCYIVF